MVWRLGPLTQQVLSYFLGRYNAMKAKDALAAGCLKAEQLAAADKYPKLRGDTQANSWHRAPDVHNLVRAALISAWQQPLTYPVKFFGPAMSPALNRAAKGNSHAMEIVCARRLVDPSPENVRVGDVVLFVHPFGGNLLVRRVLALPEQVVSDDATDHLLGPDVVWVAADNVDLKPPNVEDSRTFGPLPLEKIKARCIYAFRSPSDHGMITNHETWRPDDFVACDVEVDSEWEQAALRAIEMQDNASSESPGPS